jgi:hypothetical protein
MLHVRRIALVRTMIVPRGARGTHVNDRDQRREDSGEQMRWKAIGSSGGELHNVLPAWVVIAPETADTREFRYIASHPAGFRIIGVPPLPTCSLQTRKPAELVM